MAKFFSFAGTALKNLFSKPVTTEYPAVPKEYFERTRGHIEIDMDECVLCGMCMRSCPPGAIKVDRAAGKWSIERFDCIQCGYCAEKCPKKCLKIVPGYTEPQSEKSVTEYTKVIEKKVPHNSEECVFCTLCAKKCPVNAITVDRGEKKWEVNKEACVGCGACVANCPKKCLEMK